MEDLETWLDRVYESKGDRKTLDDLYDEWAQTYDQQIWASGNPYIAVSTGIVGRNVKDLDASILDVGCGTGNMGQILHQMGYTNLEGLDPSKGMLKIAEQKGFYKKLHTLTLAEEIDLPKNHYDAVVGAGVLTHGHAPPESLDGMLDITKPSGSIIFSLSNIAFEEMGFKEKIDELDRAGKWQQLDQSRLFRTYPFSEKEAHLRHWVYAYKKS